MPCTPCSKPGISESVPNLITELDAAPLALMVPLSNWLPLWSAALALYSHPVYLMVGVVPLAATAPVPAVVSLMVRVVGLLTTGPVLLETPPPPHAVSPRTATKAAIRGSLNFMVVLGVDKVSRV